MVMGWFIVTLSFLLLGLLAIGIKSLALYLKKKVPQGEELKDSKFVRNEKLMRTLKLEILAGDCELLAFIFCRVGIITGCIASFIAATNL